MPARFAALVLLAALIPGCALFERAPPGGLAVVAELEQTPGNIAVTPSGRLIVSQHPFADPVYAVKEVDRDGTTRPFPSDAWARAPGPGSDVGLHAVLGIECDARGIVWMLDLGTDEAQPRLVGWDTRRDELHRVIEIPAAATAPNSFVQDLAIDLEHGAIYLADMGRADPHGPSQPALIVVDLETSEVRRLLSGHRFLQPERSAAIVIDGVRPRLDDPDGPSPSFGLNPITIDADCRWVYFGAMHGRTLYRIATAHLLDESLDDEDLAARVRVYARKPVSDGISIDSADNIYVTDLSGEAITVIEPDRRPRVLTQHDQLLSWPDGISFGPDGTGYATVNQLHLHPPLHGGVDATRPPFLIVRFDPLAPGVVGR